MKDMMDIIDMLAESAKILIRTENDGNPLTRNFMEQTNYYLNAIAVIIKQLWTKKFVLQLSNYYQTTQ